MPTLIRVTINDHNIAEEFLPGGNGWGFMRSIGTEQLFETIGRAPIRTGELARSFRLSLTPIGRNNVRYTVGTYSEHAEYVIFGTAQEGVPAIWGDGNFMSPKGYPLMMLHPFFGPHPIVKRFVRGQAPNDFMDDAAQVVLGRYGVSV